jgi:hypothetical protein
MQNRAGMVGLPQDSTAPMVHNIVNRCLLVPRSPWLAPPEPRAADEAIEAMMDRLYIDTVADGDSLSWHDAYWAVGRTMSRRPGISVMLPRLGRLVSP